MNSHEAALRLLLMMRPHRADQTSELWHAQWRQSIAAVKPDARADYTRLARSPRPLLGYHPGAVLGAVVLAVVTVALLWGYRETSAAALFCLTLTPLLSHLLYGPVRSAAHRRHLVFKQGVVSVPEHEEIDHQPPTTHKQYAVYSQKPPY